MFPLNNFVSFKKRDYPYFVQLYPHENIFIYIYVQKKEKNRFANIAKYILLI